MSDQLLCTNWLSENIVNNWKSMDTCIEETGNHPEFLSKKLSKPWEKENFNKILKEILGNKFLQELNYFI